MKSQYIISNKCKEYLLEKIQLDLNWIGLIKHKQDFIEHETKMHQVYTAVCFEQLILLPDCDERDII